MRKQDTFACERLRELLPAYADGELNKIRAARVEHHLQDCPTCAAELDQLRSVSALVAASAQGLEPPVRLHASVMAAVHTASQVSTGTRRASAPLWRRVGTVAASFVCLVAVAVALAASGVLGGGILDANTAFDDNPQASDKSESEMDHPDDSPAEDWYGGYDDVHDSVDPDELDRPTTDEVGTVYLLERVSSVSDGVSADSLLAMLDGDWSGDGIWLSLVVETAQVKLSYEDGRFVVGSFVLRDHVLSILDEQGNRLDFSVEIKEGVLWLTCR